MRYLTFGEVLDLHRRILTATGGSDGIRDLGGLESAIAQPRATFDGKDLYPNLEAKVAAIEANCGSRGTPGTNGG